MLAEKIRDGKELAKVFAEHSDGKELAEIVSDFVNSYSIDTKGFLEGIREDSADVQQSLTDICYYWFLKLAYFKTKNWYDLRNKYSVETASKLMSVLTTVVPDYIHEYNGTAEGISDYTGRPYKDVEVRFGVLFVETMARQHRTLQQSFSSICFQWVSGLQDEKVKEALTPVIAELGDRFYYTPMI